MHQLLLALQAIPGLVAAAQSTLPDATGQQKQNFVVTLAYAAAGIAASAAPAGWTAILTRVIAAAVTLLWDLGVFKAEQSIMPTTQPIEPGATNQAHPIDVPHPIDIAIHAA